MTSARKSNFSVFLSSQMEVKIVIRFNFSDTALTFQYVKVFRHNSMLS